MYLGLPLFPGISQHNQLSRIIEMFGPLPEYMVTNGKNGPKYFVRDSSSQFSAAGLLPLQLGGSSSQSSQPKSKYRLKTPEEYAAEMKTEVPVLKKYLRYNRLDEIIMKCPLANKSKLTVAQKEEEVMRRQCFLNFLQGLFNLDPLTRWTAKQAFAHPFITNQPLSLPFVPPLDTRVNDRKAAYLMQCQEKRTGSTTTAVDATKPRRGSEPNVKASDPKQLEADVSSTNAPPVTQQMPQTQDPLQQQVYQQQEDAKKAQQKQLLEQQERQQLALQQAQLLKEQQYQHQVQQMQQLSPNQHPLVPPLLQLQQVQQPPQQLYYPPMNDARRSPQAQQSQQSQRQLSPHQLSLQLPLSQFTQHSPTHGMRSSQSPQSARTLSSLFPNLAQQQQLHNQAILQQKNQQRRNSDSQFHFSKNRFGQFPAQYSIPEEGPAPNLPLPFTNPQYETPQRATRTHSGDFDPRIGTFASGLNLMPPQQPYILQQYSPAFMQMQDKGSNIPPMSVSMSGLNHSFPNTQGMYSLHDLVSGNGDSSSSSSSSNSDVIRSDSVRNSSSLYRHSLTSHSIVPPHLDAPNNGQYFIPPNTSRDYSAGLAGLGSAYGTLPPANLSTGNAILSVH
jgi:chemotaxis protein histidine kinase CheA